jgi:two-component system, chemotaxis family, chemotaxis protein CheY
VGVRVLIVDDAIAARESIRGILEDANMVVVGEATTGIEAVERYKTLKPDLVTMDLVMPLMNGIEAARDILAFDARAKIVAVTGLSQPSVLAEAQEVGILGVVTKPIDKDELVTEIQTAIGG